MKVVFRKFSSGDIIALFPEVTYKSSKTVLSYTHIGLHGADDYKEIIKSTKPTKENEYKDLLAELEAIGYFDLRVQQRAKITF